MIRQPVLNFGSNTHIFRPTERLHGHLWSFPAQPVFGPCFSTGFGMTVIATPRPDRLRRSGRGGGMGGFGRVTRAKARAEYRFADKGRKRPSHDRPPPTTELWGRTMPKCPCTCLIHRSLESTEYRVDQRLFSAHGRRVGLAKAVAVELAAQLAAKMSKLV